MHGICTRVAATALVAASTAICVASIAQAQTPVLTEADADFLIDRTYSDALFALSQGNCILFRARVRDLKRLSEYRNSYWLNFRGDTLTRNRLVDDKTARAKSRLASVETEDCPRRPLDPGYLPDLRGPDFELSAGLVRLGLPKRSFLGFEPMGAPAPTLGLFSPDRNATGSSLSGSIKFILGPAGMQPYPTTPVEGFQPIGTTTYGKVSIYHSKADIDQRVGTIDPGAGNALVLPGPLGGLSGFNLGAYPLNIIHDATYSADFNRTGGRIDFGRTTKLQISFDLDFYGSAGYAHSGFDERFAGSIPGFMRDFVYTSSSNVDQLKVRAGFAVGKQFVVSQAFTTHVGVFAEVGPDLSWARGTDSLAFTGFPTSSTALSAQKTDIGFTTGVRLSAKFPNGFGIAAQISYLRATGLPVFERDGVAPTVLKLEAGDMWTASVRGSVKF